MFSFFLILAKPILNRDGGLELLKLKTKDGQLKEFENGTEKNDQENVLKSP